jgi:hypothetical protein
MLPLHSAIKSPSARGFGAPLGADFRLDCLAWKSVTVDAGSLR